MTATTDGLAENEFRLIQEIAKSPTRTQRDLSQSLGLSLGTTNLLIQRLARKGFIKITQLDWKRTQYLLTWRGAVEKTRKAYAYTLYTLRIFRQIQDNINTVLKREHDGGRREFHLVAQDEVLDLLRETVAEMDLPDTKFFFYDGYDSLPPEADQVLTATLEPPPAGSNGRRFLTIVDFDNISFRL